MKKHANDLDNEQAFLEGTRCYQCDSEVQYLFEDSRCVKCTRVVPDEDVAIALFKLGAVVITPGASSLLKTSHVDVFELLGRHASGDFGDIEDSSKTQNEIYILEGGPVLSAYDLPDEGRIWIITESDRSVTTVLLPVEY